MINSIQHFIEKETYEIEKSMRKFVEGTFDLDLYGKDLQERALNLARNILVETLETMDQMIKVSEKRRQATWWNKAASPRNCFFP